ncbi:MAG: hypothetical protein AAFX03_09375 [Pseudomonadota bacterium]
MKSIAAMITGLAALAGPSFASEADTTPTDILGAWTFQTQPYRDGVCRMSGMMHLKPDPSEAGVYACELTAVEECSDIGRSVVVQSCVARRFNSQVSIRSNIEEMLEKKMEGLVYVPDNFALTVQSANRMFGSLVSAVTAPVEFRRNLDGVS